MLCRSQIGIFAIAMGLLVTTSAGQAADDTKYPNWKGQWFANNQIVHGQVALVFDPTRNSGTWTAGAAHPGISEGAVRTAWPSRPTAVSAITDPQVRCPAACRA